MNQNSDQKECLVIVNPNAGNGKGKKDWERYPIFLKAKLCLLQLNSQKKKAMLSILQLKALRRVTGK